MADNALGDYLRARRESLRPGDVGLKDDGRRRLVAGLRREEVASLSGISPDYYLRLEQGRERHPSGQVIAALSRALLLGPSSEEFLHRLVRPLPDRGHARDGSGDPGRLTAFVHGLTTPAYAHDRVLEVLVANRQATALSPSFAPGVNLLEAVFVDPGIRRIYRDWEEMTVRMVSYLRAQAATPPYDERLPALVADVSARSARFAELWARQEVGAVSTGRNRLDHPVAGPLEVNYERLCFAGTDHPVIIFYHADRGSPSEAALDRLLALDADVGRPALT